MNTRDYNREYKQKRRQQDPLFREQEKQIERDKYASDPEYRTRKLQRNKAWREANPEAHKRNILIQHLKKRFGITIEQYEEMLQRQQNTCAICKQPSKNARRLDIDHCHKTGQVRGLLCNDCNTGLGRFRESLTSLQNAIDYLTKHN